MKNQIIELLDEILKFEKVEKDNLSQKKLLLHEINDMESKITQMERGDLLDGVLDEIVHSLQASSSAIQDRSVTLNTEHTFLDMSKSVEQSKKLESKPFEFSFNKSKHPLHGRDQRKHQSRRQGRPD